jgi:hypothetical protein
MNDWLSELDRRAEEEDPLRLTDTLFVLRRLRRISGPPPGTPPSTMPAGRPFGVLKARRPEG